MVSRATANLLLGIVIGGCVVIVAERARRIRFDDDPKAIAKRLGRRIKTLESRVAEVASQRATASG
jgi:hypothetical protein